MLTIAGMLITIIDYENKALPYPWTAQCISAAALQGLANTVVRLRAPASMCEHQSTLSGTCSHSRTSMAISVPPSA